MSLMHSPPVAPTCVSCLVKKMLDRYPRDTSREAILDYQRRLGAYLSDLPDRTCGPEIQEALSRIHAISFGDHSDEEVRRYAAIKEYFNALMADFAETERLSERIHAAQDPLRVALGYAMMGNFIDFGAFGSVDESKLRDLLGTAEHQIAPDAEEYVALREALKCARRMAFLTDNCGEIVMDKLLVAYVRRAFPEIDLTVIVRGAPVLNDATMEDARQIGLDRLPGVRVMGNGDGLAGTALGRISSEADAAIRAADIILSKGQGNYETLRGCGLPIWYAFLCKCAFFADRFGVPLYTGMLVRECGENACPLKPRNGVPCAKGT